MGESQKGCEVRKYETRLPTTPYPHACNRQLGFDHCQISASSFRVGGDAGVLCCTVRRVSPVEKEHRHRPEISIGQSLETRIQQVVLKSFLRKEKSDVRSSSER